MMTTVRNRLGKMLAKSAGKLYHDKIDRLQVQEENASLKELQGSFKTIHQAYLHNMEVGKDETEEDALVEKQEQHYEEVMEKI